ncbi:DUF6893 family small protein [Streptomyces sp. NPDC017936]
MRNGIFVPAHVVRAVVGAVGAAAVVIALAELPGMRRYVKLRSM